MVGRLQIRGCLKLHANVRNRRGTRGEVDGYRAPVHRRKLRPLPVCTREMVKHWIAQVKKVQRKIEVLAWCDGSLIERRGTNHEWSRPIGKPAGPCARGCGLEDTRIVFGVRDGTKDAPERA